LSQKYETYDQYVVTGRHLPLITAVFPANEVSDPFRFFLQPDEDDFSQAHIAMESICLLIRARQSCITNIVSSEPMVNGAFLPVKPSKVALSNSREPLKVESG